MTSPELESVLVKLDSVLEVLEETYKLLATMVYEGLEDAPSDSL